MPTDDRLMATPEADANAETRRMVERWGRLHAGRSGLGAASTLVLLRAALGWSQPSSAPAAAQGRGGQTSPAL